MSLLLDTHVLLWIAAGAPRLGPTTERLLADPTRLVFVSAASAWEMAIKSSIGRLRIPNSFEPLLEAYRFAQLPIRTEHAWAVRELPHHHRDPFDRILIAQAQVDGLSVVSVDTAFSAYEVDVIDARV